MPIQYLYARPCGSYNGASIYPGQSYEVLNGGRIALTQVENYVPVLDSHPAYSIDSASASPEDDDYLVGTGDKVYLHFVSDALQVIPTAVTYRLRYVGSPADAPISGLPTGQSSFKLFTANSGSAGLASVNGYYGSTNNLKFIGTHTDLPNHNTEGVTFQTYTIPTITDSNSDNDYLSGNWFSNLSTDGNCTYCEIEIPLSDSSFTITSVEIEVSGYLYEDTHLFCCNNINETGLPLFVGASDNLNSGSTLYINAETSDTLRLFIKGYGEEISSNVPLILSTNSGNTTGPISLAISNFETSSGNLNLYISAATLGELNGTLPIIIYNDGEKQATQNLTVFSNDLASGNSNTQLYINSFLTESGVISLYMNSEFSNLSESGSMNLHIMVDYPSGSVPMFIKNVPIPISGNTTFYIKSSDYASGSINMYVSGGGVDLRNETTTLFISNFETQSGNTEFYILGNTSTASIPLIVKGKEVDENYSGVHFFLLSDSGNQLYNTSELIINAEGITNNIPFYIGAPTSGQESGAINLYVLCDTTTTHSAFLYVNHNGSGLNESVKLFTAGEGMFDGAFVARDSINLYMNAGNEGIGDVVPIIINGPSGETISANMIISGGYLTSDSVYLNIPSTVNPMNNSATTYVHGY